MHAGAGGRHLAPSTTTTDLEDIERATIQRVFEQVKGDKALAGRMLGISRATLYRKLKRYNISVGIRLARPATRYSRRSESCAGHFETLVSW